MKLSIIIPAHNEAFVLASTLHAIFSAAKSASVPFEVIVVNDASTDETPSIAKQAGAHVIDVNKRQIAAVRNAGARIAQGEFFLFVDADTQVNAAVVGGAIQAMDAGAVGGGSLVDFDSRANRVLAFLVRIFNAIYMRGLGWAAGCFIFVRRDAFQKVGGFDETLYASEEVALSRRLKAVGRFVILKESVVTSSRKMRLFSPLWLLGLLIRMLFQGRRVLERREGLDLWYTEKREKPPL